MPKGWVKEKPRWEKRKKCFVRIEYNSDHNLCTDCIKEEVPLRIVSVCMRVQDKRRVSESIKGDATWKTLYFLARFSGMICVLRVTFRLHIYIYIYIYPRQARYIDIQLRAIGIVSQDNTGNSLPLELLRFGVSFRALVSTSFHRSFFYPPRGGASSSLLSRGQFYIPPAEV
jgi:hypothetical protein